MSIRDDRSAIAAVLDEAYSLPGATLDRLPVGQVTINYEAHVGGSTLFVKQYLGGDLDAELASIEQAQRAGQAGVPVATVRPSTAGEGITRSGDLAVSVWEWVTGSTVQDGLTPVQQRAAGDALGRIHVAFASHPAGILPSPKLDKWLHPDIGRIKMTIDKLLTIVSGQEQRGTFDEDAVRTLSERRAVLHRIPGLLDGLPSLSTQVIHGDYSPVNILFSGDELTAVTDFLPQAPFLVAYELGRIAFDVRTIVYDEDWLASALRLVAAYREANPDVRRADVVYCARATLLQLLTSLYGVKDHYLKPGLIQDDLDNFWLLRHAAATRLLDHLNGVEDALAQT